MRGIAQTVKVVGKTLACLFLEYRLVRIFARTEELDGQSGQHFKFDIRRTCTAGGYGQLTRGIGLHQSAEVRAWVLRKLNALNRHRIDEGFQLQKQDVRVFLILVLLREQHGIVIAEFFFIENRQDLLLAVAVRFTDAGVQPGIDKTVDHAIIPISIGEVAEESLYDACPDHKGGRQEGKGDDQQHCDQIAFAFHAAPFLWSFDEQQHKQSDSDQPCGDGADNLIVAEVIRHDGQAVIEITQILDGERRHALCQNHAVDDADTQPEDRNDRKEKHAPLRQGCKHQGRIQDQRII